MMLHWLLRLHDLSNQNGPSTRHAVKTVTSRSSFLMGQHTTFPGRQPAQQSPVSCWSWIQVLQQMEWPEAVCTLSKLPFGEKGFILLKANLPISSLMDHTFSVVLRKPAQLHFLSKSDGSHFILEQ